VASLIENLIDTLNKEDTEYKELLDIAEKKTDAIVKNDIDVLQVIVSKEQQIIERLDALEAARQEHVGDISNVLNIPLEEMKVDRLIRIMENQPEIQAQLIKVHDSLKKTMNRLVMLNDKNRVLLKENLEMLEFEINLAKSTRMAPVTANYGKDAYGVGQPGGEGLFDARQ